MCLTLLKDFNDRSIILPAVSFIGWLDIAIINIRLRADIGDS